jgi:hypothetical protein
MPLLPSTVWVTRRSAAVRDAQLAQLRAKEVEAAQKVRAANERVVGSLDAERAVERTVLWGATGATQHVERLGPAYQDDFVGRRDDGGARERLEAVRGHIRAQRRERSADRTMQ